MKMIYSILLVLSSALLLKGGLSNALVDDLSYTLPEGWRVASEPWGLRFITPSEGENNPNAFQPEVTLRIREGSLNIDQKAGADFAEVIKKQLIAGGWGNVRLAEPRIMEIRPGYNVMLYYANVEASERSLVQSIAVFSSSSQHYVFTYTDLVEFFSSGNDKMFKQSWEVVQSFIHRDGFVGERPSPWKSWTYGLLAIVVSVGSFFGVRSLLSSSKYARLAENIPDEPEEKSEEIEVQATALPESLPEPDEFEQDENIEGRDRNDRVV